MLGTGDPGFWKLMNAEIPEMATYIDNPKFTNVWDRKALFLHTTFVSDTRAGYLGRGGEFYRKPSKD
jgi:hypothetical protein